MVLICQKCSDLFFASPNFLLPFFFFFFFNVLVSIEKKGTCESSFYFLQIIKLFLEILTTYAKFDFLFCEVRVSQFCIIAAEQI